MEFIIVLALIILNGILSMSEIAIISVRRSKLKVESLQGNNNAKTALKLAEDPDVFLSTIQIGITLIGIITGVFSGDVLAGYLSPLFEKMGLTPVFSYNLARILIVIIVTYLTLIIGELVPKRIGMSNPEKIAKIVARPMNFLSKITYPFVWILSKSTSFLVRILGIKSNDNKVTEEEIKSMVQEGTEDGEVQVIEQDIVGRVFTLGDRKVESIMTHRNDIVWIDANMSLKEIKQIVQANMYESYPVADGSLEEVLGMIMLKDLFAQVDEPDFNLRNIITPATCFPENMDVYKAFEQMKAKHVKQALIFDEFGSIQGVITFMDILEALVGEIPDETDEPQIVKRKEGGWLVDGQWSFYDFLDHFELENLYAENDYNTISGLLLDLLEHVPSVGETVEWNNFRFEIVDMDGARIDKILVTKTK